MRSRDMAGKSISVGVFGSSSSDPPVRKVEKVQLARKQTRGVVQRKREIVVWKWFTSTFKESEEFKKAL